jgi:hypothetical protein
MRTLQRTCAVLWWVGLCACRPAAQPQQQDGPRETAVPPAQMAPAEPGREQGPDQPVEQPAAMEWQLVFDLPAGKEGPRMAEVFLEHAPGAQLQDAQPLEVAQQAGKQVVAQAQENNRLRVLVFSTANTQRLGPGPWVRLRFLGNTPPALRVVHADSHVAGTEVEVSPATLSLVAVERAP